jgi:hypothetical protein
MCYSRQEAGAGQRRKRAVARAIASDVHRLPSRAHLRRQDRLGAHETLFLYIIDCQHLALCTKFDVYRRSSKDRCTERVIDFYISRAITMFRECTEYDYCVHKITWQTLYPLDNQDMHAVHKNYLKNRLRSRLPRIVPKKLVSVKKEVHTTSDWFQYLLSIDIYTVST